MQFGIVIGNVISTDKNPAYEERKLLLVQRLSLDNRAMGIPTMAIDYVGAGEGDIVLLGAAPGLASTVFGIPDAPIRELVMGVIDRARFSTGQKEFGNSVSERHEKNRNNT
ncbi:EutN/CcmL family microcompartment protein [Candidatus Sumerlaeota bacterium]|nr:EutN/CcmL family microcompartment protein [Candidatus Sumerlaeota bacterium]